MPSVSPLPPLHHDILSPKIVRRCALAAALVSVITVYFFPATAGASAIFLSLVLCSVVYIRVHAWNELPPRSEGAPELEEKIHAREIGMRTTLVIGTSLCLLALAVAGVLVDWEFTVIGIAFVLCAMVIFGAPVWLAGVGEEEEDVHELQTGEHRSSR